MASTYQLDLVHDLGAAFRKTFKALTTGSPSEIKVGDPIEANASDQVQLLEDDTVTADFRYVGISQTNWIPTQTYASVKNDIDVVMRGVFVARLASAQYKFGDPLQYDASADNGALKAGAAGNLEIAKFYDTKGSSAVTSGEVWVDTLKDGNAFTVFPVS